MDSGALHVKNEKVNEAKKLLTERGIKVFHIEDGKGYKSLFIDVSNLETGSELLERRGIENRRSH